MYCIHCGTEIPDEANFCWKCGKPQTSTAKSAPSTKEPYWETCEIVCEIPTESGHLRKITNIVGALITASADDIVSDHKFIARAIGPNGVYVVGQTQNYYGGENDRGAQKEISKLIERMAKDGWESTGKGEKWYNYKFRRRVK